MLTIVYAAFRYEQTSQMNLFKWIRNYVSMLLCLFRTDQFNCLKSDRSNILESANWRIKNETPFLPSYYLIEARLRHWLPTRPQMAAPDAGKIIPWILIYRVFRFSVVARTVMSGSSYEYFFIRSITRIGVAKRKAKCTRRRASNARRIPIHIEFYSSSEF